jgi:rhodanese-related sulfurtransferase
MQTTLIVLGLVVMALVLVVRAVHVRRSATEAKQWVASGAKLVDVRSPAEFSSGHIQGALNIPVEEVRNRAGKVLRPDQPVVVYCLSGARSAMAARQLKEAGFQRVHDLGPMSAW